MLFENFRALAVLFLCARALRIRRIQPYVGLPVPNPALDAARFLAIEIPFDLTQLQCLPLDLLPQLPSSYLIGVNLLLVEKALGRQLELPHFILPLDPSPMLLDRSLLLVLIIKHQKFMRDKVMRLQFPDIGFVEVLIWMVLLHDKFPQPGPPALGPRDHFLRVVEEGQILRLLLLEPGLIVFVLLLDVVFQAMDLGVRRISVRVT